MKIAKDYNAVKKDALDLFKFVVDIAAATIIGKRVIVPLIATPLAKKVEKKLDAKHNHDINTNNKQENTPQQPEQTKVPNFENNQNSNLLEKFKK